MVPLFTVSAAVAASGRVRRLPGRVVDGIMAGSVSGRV